MANIDPAMRDALMQSPEVQNAIKHAGEDALKDPAVQAAIKKKALETLTAENAAAVAEKLQEWALDPEVQAKAKHFAGIAMIYAGQSGQAIIGCIEQGPTGVRLLAFFAACSSLVLTVLTLINPLNLLSLATYTVCIYQTVFALTTMLFEAKPEWIAKVAVLSSYQDTLISNCNFITKVGGRGAFYVFQGSLWLGQASWTEFHELGVGLFQIFVGLLHVAMHFGKLNWVSLEAKTLLAKVEGSQYQAIPTAEPPA